MFPGWATGGTQEAPGGWFAPILRRKADVSRPSLAKPKSGSCPGGPRGLFCTHLEAHGHCEKWLSIERDRHSRPSKRDHSTAQRSWVGGGENLWGGPRPQESGNFKSVQFALTSGYLSVMRRDATAEHSTAEHSRAEQSRAEQSRAEHST